MGNVSHWQYLPTEVLEEQERTDKAKAWADGQRALVAQQWADAQRQMAALSFGVGEEDVQALAPTIGFAGFSDIPVPETPSDFDSGASGDVLAGARPELRRFGATPQFDPSQGGILTTALEGVGQQIGENLREFSGQAGLERARGRIGQREQELGRPLRPEERIDIQAEEVAPAIENIAAGVSGGMQAPLRSTDPAIRKVAEMYAKDRPEVDSQLFGKLETFRQALVKATTDRAVGVAEMQKLAEKELGRKLNADEMLYELIRLDPNKAAQVRLQEDVKPVLQRLSPDDQDYLKVYLTFQDNIDVAKAMGRRAEGEVLARDLGPVKGSAQLQRAEARLRKFEQMASGQQTIDPDLKKKLAASQRQVQRAQAKVDTNRQLLEQERTAAAQQRRIDVETERAFSGDLDVIQSQQGLRALEAELGTARYRQIEQAANDLYEFNRKQLERVRDAGLIPDEVYQQWLNDYPHYMPTRILDYLESDAGRMLPRGKAFSVSDAGFRKNTLEGTKREREDPLASMYRLAFASERNIRRNEAFNAFVKLREASPSLKNAIKEVSESYAPVKGEEKVHGFVNGEKHVFAMPKDMAQLVSMEAEAPIRGLNTAMGIFRAMATSRNPIFLGGNAVLDAASYTARESSRLGGPQNLPVVVKALLDAYIDAFRGVRQGEFKGQTAEFLKSGGGMFGFFPGTPKEAARGVADLTRKNVLDIRSKQELANVVKDLLTLKPVESLGERIELAPRVAAFKLAKQRGANQVEATIAGRSVTIDFAQGGTIAKYLNQFLPFFNVGVQAAAQPFRAARENPRGFATTAITLLAGPTVAAEAWNRSDPQRARDYEDVPQYEKDQGVVIMLPGEAPIDARGNRRPQYILIRMREYAPFVMLTREAVRKALGDDARSWGELLVTGAVALSPVQDPSGLLTPGIGTAAQLWANRDMFRRRDIATQRGDEEASELSKGISRFVGLRPSQVEFAVGDIASGIGRLAQSASNIGREPLSGVPQDIPVAGEITRRFVRSGIGEGLQQARDDRISAANLKILQANGIQDVGMVGNTIQGKPLRTQEQARYQQLANRAINQAIREVVQDPDYRIANPSERRELLQRAMNKARLEARKEFLATFAPGVWERRAVGR